MYLFATDHETVRWSIPLTDGADQHVTDGIVSDVALRPLPGEMRTAPRRLAPGHDSREQQSMCLLTCCKHDRRTTLWGTA